MKRFCSTVLRMGKTLFFSSSRRALTSSSYRFSTLRAYHYRRQGIGAALMNAMLRDDKEHGSQASVLLASHAGAMLYPQLGYEKIGELLLFVPQRKR